MIMEQSRQQTFKWTPNTKYVNISRKEKFTGIVSICCKVIVTKYYPNHMNRLPYWRTSPQAENILET